MPTMQQLQTDEFDLDQGLDFDGSSDFDSQAQEDPDVRSGSRSPVMSAFKAAYSGVEEALRNNIDHTQVVDAAVSHVLPKQYGEIFKQYNDIKSGVTNLYNDAVKELRPTLSRTIRHVDRLIPQESVRTRAFLEKIKDLVGDDYKSYAYDKDLDEQTKIDAAMLQVFAAQSQEQTRQRHEDQAEERIREQIETTRDDRDVRMLFNIDNNLSRLTQYNEKVNQAFQKKTLELQFRSYFLQQDLLSTQRRFFGVFESQNAAVIKNTALPEYAKITKYESFRENSRQKFNENVRSGLFGDGDFVKKGFENIRKSTMAYVKELGGAFEQGLTASVMMQSMDEGLEDESAPELSSQEKILKTITSFLTEEGMLAAGRSARRWMNTSSGPIPSAVREYGFKGATVATNLPGFLANLRDSDLIRPDFEDDLFKKTFKEAARWGLDNFLKQDTDMSLLDKPGLGNLNRPAIFDNKVHKSITEIMPGYLSRILRELQVTRTGNDKIGLTEYNFLTDKFSSRKGIAKAIKRGLKKSAQEFNYGKHLDRMTEELTEGSDISDEAKKKLSEFLRDKSLKRSRYDPRDFLKSEYMSQLPQQDRRKLQKHFIKKFHSGDQEQVAKNIYDFSQDMLQLRGSVVDLRGMIESITTAGYGDMLTEMGLLKQNGLKRTIDMESYKRLSMSDDEELEAEKKEDLKRAAAGLPTRGPTRSWDKDSFDLSGNKVTDRLDKIIEALNKLVQQPSTAKPSASSNDKDPGIGPNEALSDIEAKEDIEPVDPKQALENNRKTGIFKWKYKKGKGDEGVHTGPMAQDVQKQMGDKVAPDGKKIDLVSLNGNNMAAIEALRREQETIKKDLKQTKKQRGSVSVVDSIKQDTTKIVELLESKGIKVSSIPKFGLPTDNLLGTVTKVGKYALDAAQKFANVASPIVSDQMAKMPARFSKAAGATQTGLGKAGDVATEVGGKLKNLLYSGLDAGENFLSGFGRRAGRYAEAAGEQAGDVGQSIASKATKGVLSGIKAYQDVNGSILNKENIGGFLKWAALASPISPFAKFMTLGGFAKDWLLGKEGGGLISAGLNALGGITGGGLGGSGNRIYKVLTDIREILNNRLPGDPMEITADPGQGLMQRAAAKVAGGALETVSGGISNFASSVGSKVFGVSKKTIDEQGGWLAAGQNLAGAVGNKVKDGVGELAPMAESVLPGSTGKLAKMKDGVAEGMSTVGKAATLGGGLGLAGLANLVTGATSLTNKPNKIKDAAAKASEAVKEKVEASSGLSSLSDKLDSAKELLSEKTGGAVSTVKDVAEATKEKAEIIPGAAALSAAAAGAKAGVSEKVAGLVDSARETADAVKQPQSLQQKMAEGVSKAKDVLESAPAKKETAVDSVKEKLNNFDKGSIGGMLNKVLDNPLVQNDKFKKAVDFAGEALKTPDGEVAAQAPSTVVQTQSNTEIHRVLVQIRDILDERLGPNQGKLGGAATRVGNAFARLRELDKRKEDKQGSTQSANGQGASTAPKYRSTIGLLPATGAIVKQAIMAKGNRGVLTGILGKALKLNPKEMISTMPERLGEAKKSLTPAEIKNSTKAFLNKLQGKTPETSPSFNDQDGDGDRDGNAKDRLEELERRDQSSEHTNEKPRKATSKPGFFSDFLDRLKNPRGRKKLHESQDAQNGAIKDIEDKESRRFGAQESLLTPEQKLSKAVGKLLGNGDYDPGQNTPTAFNDQDGDGDRDGNAKDRLEELERRKEEKRAAQQSQAAVQGQNAPRYHSDQSVLGWLGDKAKSAGSLLGAGASALGAAADLKSIFGRNKPQTTVPTGTVPGTQTKPAGKLSGMLKGGGKLALGAGAAYGLASLAENYREEGNETAANALSMGANAAGLYSLFQGARLATGALAGAGGMLGGTAAAGSAALGATAAAGTAAVGATTTVLGSVLAGIGGILSAPIVAIPLATAAASFGIYKAYKYFTRDSASPVEAFRLAQYGLGSSQKDKYHIVYNLESYLNENALGYKDGIAYLIEKKIDPKEVLSIFDIEVSDAEGVRNLSTWLENRFRPVYLGHVTALYKYSPKTRLDSVNDVPPDLLAKYLKLAEYPEGNYGEMTSPSKAVGPLSAGPQEVATAFKAAASYLENPKAQSGKQPDGEKPLTAGKKEETSLGVPKEKSFWEKSFGEQFDDVKKTASAALPVSFVAGLTSLKNKIATPDVSKWTDTDYLAKKALEAKSAVVNNTPDLVKGFTSQVATGASSLFDEAKKTDVVARTLKGAGEVKDAALSYVPKDIKELASFENVGKVAKDTGRSLVGLAPDTSKLIPSVKESTGVSRTGDLPAENKPQETNQVNPAVVKEPGDLLGPMDGLGENLALAAGGLGITKGIGSLFGSKKVPDAPVPPATSPAPVSQAAPKAFKAPSLLSRGLKLGAAGGIAYGLAKLAEQARDGGNETLANGLSMGANVAGGYGLFQGLSAAASLAAKAGGITGAIGSAGVAASTATGAAGSMAASAGGTVLGALGTGVAAVLASPLFYVPAAIAGLTYVGYKVRKAYKRAVPTALVRHRMAQYGFSEPTKEHYPKVMLLEEYLNENVLGYKDGKAYLMEKKLDTKEVFDILGVSIKDAKAVSNAMEWFNNRFKPVYLSHVTALYAFAPKTRLEDIESLSDEVKRKYLETVELPDISYDGMTSPIPGLTSLSAGADEVEEAYQTALKYVGKNAPVEKSAPFLQAAKATAVSMIPDLSPSKLKQKAEDLIDGASNTLKKASDGNLLSKDEPKELPKALSTYVRKAVLDDTRELSALETVRFKMYGLKEITQTTLTSMRALEKYVAERCKVDSHLDVKLTVDIVHLVDTTGGYFGVVKDTPQASKWVTWYYKRFLPVFTTYLSESFKEVQRSEPGQIEGTLSPAGEYSVALKMTGNGSVWSVRAGPFPEEAVNFNPSSLDGVMRYLKGKSKERALPEKSQALEPTATTPVEKMSNPVIEKQDSGKPSTATQESAKAMPPEAKRDVLAPVPAAPVVAGITEFERTIQGVESDSEEPVKAEVNKPPKDKSRPQDTKPPTVSVPAIPEAPGPVRNGLDGFKYVKKANNGVDLSGLNETMARNFLGMAQEYGELTGRPIVVNSAYRSRAKQEALYRADPKKAAPPGKSLHQFGLAMDINSGTADKLESLGLMRKYGFTRPVGGEGWHIEPAGIQVNIAKAREDKAFASQAIAASPGRGGGGAWNDSRTRKYGRNTSLQIAALNAGTAQPLSLDKPKTAGANDPLLALKTPKQDAPKKPEPVSKGPADTVVSKDTGQASGFIKSSYTTPTTELQSLKGEPSSPAKLTPGPLQFKPRLPDAEAPPPSGGSSNQKLDKKFGNVKELIAKGALRAGVSPDYMQTIAAMESSLNPNIVAEGTGATGLFQFLPDTWKYITKKAGKKYGITPQTPMTDPEANTIMAIEYSKHSEQEVRAAKPNPKAADFYLAHFLGPTGGSRMLRADPTDIAAKITPDAAAQKVNAPLFFNDKAKTQPSTVGQFYDRVVAKLENTAKSFGIKFTNRYYADDPVQSPGEQPTKFAEAKPSLAKPATGVYRNGKVIEGDIPGTVSDKPNRYPVFGSGLLASLLPNQETQKLDSYSAGNNKSQTFQPPKPVTSTKEPVQETTSADVAKTTPAVSKETYKTETYPTRSGGSVQIAEVPVKAFAEESVGLTGLMTSYRPTVLDSSPLKQKQNNVVAKNNLVNNVDTSAVILNESLSVQKQMLDVLKNILAKSGQVIKIQEPPKTMSVAKSVPVKVEEKLQPEVQPSSVLATSAFNTKPEPLPTPAVSLRRSIG